MRIIADLHIHSKYSRATSKKMDVQHLERQARRKGLDLLGTGDFTHPKWLEHLKEELSQEGDTGVYKSQDGFSFILSAEVSNIFQKDGETKKIHNMILAKNFEVVEKINDFFSGHGDLEEDARPTFRGLTCAEMVENLKEISSDIEIISAHAWTPWFSLFGSKSGFDSIEDCYEDQTKHINALETGLSSDPGMNWRLSELDDYTLISNSDSHSPWPWRIGREANIFELEKITYDKILNAIRSGDPERFLSTIEVPPCFSPETEIVTTKGIKKIEEIEKGDTVYSINPETLGVEKKPVRKVYSQNYEGTMYHIKGRQIGFEVTPEHRLLVSRQKERRKNGWYEEYAFRKISELKNYSPTQRWRFPSVNNDSGGNKSRSINMLNFLPEAMLRVNASIPRFDIKLKDKGIPYHLTGKHHRFTVKPEYISKVLDLKEYIEEILVQYIPHSPMRRLDDFFVDLNTFLKIAGMYVAEGSSDSPKRHRANLSIQDDQIRREVCNELEKININYGSSERGISINGWFVDVLAKEFGSTSHVKKLPDWIYDLDRKRKELFLKWMYKGDGHRDYIRYTTVSKRLCHDLIRLLVEIGFIPRYYDHEETKNAEALYRIVWQKDYSTFSWKDNISQKQYKGKIYCLSVEDNHTVLAGVNGKFQFIGQSYGKYHFDGHRKCDVAMDPKEAIKNNNKCPECGKELTIGVEHRVEELADRDRGFVLSEAPDYVDMMPLSEIISHVLGIKDLYSKTIKKELGKLTNEFGSEFQVLLNTDYHSLKKVTKEKIAKAIIQNRGEEYDVKPGYDGVYGEPIFSFEKKEKETYETGQSTLDDY